MGLQTEYSVGGPIRLPAAAGVIALANAALGRGLVWDASAANLALAGDDDRVDFVVDDIHVLENEVSVIPFTADRQFRVRCAASLTAALAKGKLVKAAANGLFDTGGAANDVNVAICEEASVANGLALVRPIPGGLEVTPA